MPAQAPAVTAAAGAELDCISQHIRARRKDLRISATAAAESAAMSRVTWHRIERGEPSVTMGAYLNATTALGLVIDVVSAQPAHLGLSRPHLATVAGQATDSAADVAAVADDTAPPTHIRLADCPQLARLAWQIADTTVLTAQEALGLYERNWRHVDQAAMDERERDLLQRLVNTLGQGHLLV